MDPLTDLAARAVPVPGWVLALAAAIFIWRTAISPSLHPVARLRKALEPGTTLVDLMAPSELFAHVVITQGVTATRQALMNLLRKRHTSMPSDLEAKSQVFLREHGNALFLWILEPTTAPLLRQLQEIAEEQGAHHAEAVLSGALGSILVHNARVDGAIVPDDHNSVTSTESDTSAEEIVAETDGEETDAETDGAEAGDAGTDAEETDAEETDAEETDVEETDAEETDAETDAEETAAETDAEETAAEEIAAEEIAEETGAETDGSSKIGNTGVRRAVARASVSQGIEDISASMPAL